MVNDNSKLKTVSVLAVNTIGMLDLEGPGWGYYARVMKNDGLSTERGASYSQARA